MNKIVLKDKVFNKFISCDEIQKAIEELAAKINHDYRDRERPIFLGILNGSFMFMADLMKCIDFECEASFIKIASYAEQSSTGCVTELIGLSTEIEGRHIVVVEDIVDTGTSISHLWSSLGALRPASIEVATLLFKPKAYAKEIPIKYSALEISNDFIVGYGLDYDQLGRNLKHIYKIEEK